MPIQAKQIRKILQWASYSLLPLGLIIASFVKGADSHFYEELGEPALSLLTFILFLTPVTQILNWSWLRRLMTWRREFGVAAFWLFLFHSAGMIFSKNLTTIADYMDPKSYLFWGAIAGVGMLLLGLTSNDIAVKTLRKNWKRLQYVAIPTLFFAHAHVAMIDGNSVLPAVLLFSGYLLLRIVGYYMVKKRQTTVPQHSA